MALTDLRIRSTKIGEKPIKLTDSGGLYLEVRPSGAKLWRYRYRIAGKENVFAIGEYPAVGLADARAARGRARELVRRGVHPAHDRRTALATQITENANTFKAVANVWIEKRKNNWSPYYALQVARFLKNDVFPSIGELPIRAVTATQVVDIMEKLEGRGAVTVAILVRQWISAIFRYAVAKQRADADPAAAVKGAVVRPDIKHCRPLNRLEIIGLVKALEAYGGYRTTVIALRLMLLTFVRTVELRAATWGEFDLKAGYWRIPAERMKMRQQHLVPLSTQAVDLLRELFTYTGGRDFLFPNYRNPKTCMTATTLNRALERMGYAGKGTIGFSAHGFRATASTFLNEMGFRADAIERQLAHIEGRKVRGIYNHAEYLEERTKMMQSWADYLEQLEQGAPPVIPPTTTR